MRKVRYLLVVAMVGASSLFSAAPAQASCDTELGDMCKAVDVVRGAACFGKHQYYLAFCQT